MAGGIKFSIDQREFNAAFRKYIQVSKREIADICNTKAFFIARGATRFTPKADKKEIVSDLGKIIKMKGGKRRLQLKESDYVEGVPLAALIINARRRKEGLPGLFKEKMTEAIEAMITARVRSVAFLKSGWLPAIKTLEALVKNKRGAPTIDGSAKMVGQPKGKAIPARPGMFVKAIIENSASARGDKSAALIRYGQPALQKAFDAEAASMQQYAEDKLKAAARASGIRAS